MKPLVFKREGLTVIAGKNGVSFHDYPASTMLDAEAAAELGKMLTDYAYQSRTDRPARGAGDVATRDASAGRVTVNSSATIPNFSDEETELAIDDALCGLPGWRTEMPNG